MKKKVFTVVALTSILFTISGCFLNETFDKNKVDFSSNLLINNKYRASAVAQDNTIYFSATNRLYEIKNYNIYNLGQEKDRLTYYNKSLYYMAAIEGVSDDNMTLCVSKNSDEKILIKEALDYRIIKGEIYYLTLNNELINYSKNKDLNIKLDNLYNFVKYKNNLIYEKDNNEICSLNLKNNKNKVLYKINGEIKDINIINNKLYVITQKSDETYLCKYDLNTKKRINMNNYNFNKKFYKCYYTKENYYILTYNDNYYYLYKCSYYNDSEKICIKKIGDTLGTNFTECNILLINNKNIVINYDDAYILIYKSNGDIITRTKIMQ